MINGTRNLQQHVTVELLCRSVQRCNLVKMHATMPMGCSSIEIAQLSITNKCQSCHLGVGLGDVVDGTWLSILEHTTPSGEL